MLLLTKPLQGRIRQASAKERKKERKKERMLKYCQQLLHRCKLEAEERQGEVASQKNNDTTSFQTRAHAERERERAATA